MSVVSWIDSRFYPGFSRNWDDDHFRRQILLEISKEFIILDLGAGAGIVPQMNFKGLTVRVCGVDPDSRVTENQHLDDGRVGFGETIPWPDNTFDLVFCDNVLEHLENPSKVFMEVFRVLKPSGVFLAKTPNKWHYVPLIAKLTPLWFHKKVVSWRGRKADDVFPTQYLANTAREILHHAENAGLILDSIDYIDGRPEYLRFSSLTYLVGLAYERLVSNISSLRFFRVVLVARLVKKPSRVER